MNHEGMHKQEVYTLALYTLDGSDVDMPMKFAKTYVNERIAEADAKKLCAEFDDDERPIVTGVWLGEFTWVEDGEEIRDADDVGDIYGAPEISIYERFNKTAKKFLGTRRSAAFSRLARCRFASSNVRVAADDGEGMPANYLSDNSVKVRDIIKRGDAFAKEVEKEANESWGDNMRNFVHTLEALDDKCADMPKDKLLLHADKIEDWGKQVERVMKLNGIESVKPFVEAAEEAAKLLRDGAKDA